MKINWNGREGEGHKWRLGGQRMWGGRGVIEG